MGNYLVSNSASFLKISLYHYLLIYSPISSISISVSTPVSRLSPYLSLYLFCLSFLSILDLGEKNTLGSQLACPDLAFCPDLARTLPEPCLDLACLDLAQTLLFVQTLPQPCPNLAPTLPKTLPQLCPNLAPTLRRRSIKLPI